MKKLFVIPAILLALACSKQDCSTLESSYETPALAISAITKAEYKFKEIKSTPNSSSIKRLEYYSCDGVTGFLIVYTLTNDQFLHKGVPLEEWKEISTSKYVKNYYNDNIKGKYAF